MALFQEFIAKALGDEAPDVPAFIPVNAQEQQKIAIGGNLSALPTIQALASQYNQFNVDEINKALGTTDPYQNQIATQLSKNRLDWSKGVMSKDLADQVQLLSATRAVGGGFGGSGAHNNLLARNYGLTSLALQEKAQSSEESWLRTASAIYQPGMFNVSSMMVTPQQQLALAVEERNAKFQHDYVQAQWDWYGSWGQTMIRFEDTVVQLAGDVAGAVGMMCWVARECLGTKDDRWLLFRHWMLNKAPNWFRNLYLKHGEQFAKWIHNKPVLKSIIRSWMESRIATLEVSRGFV